MSRRVTRASARQSADLSASNTDNPRPPSAPNPTRASSRKRKASELVPDQEEDLESAPDPSSSRRKRTRRSGGEEVEVSDSPPNHRNKGKRTSVMSSSGDTSRNDPDPTSPSTTASSKKKAKSKEASTIQTDKRRSSGSKKTKKTKSPPAPPEEDLHPRPEAKAKASAAAQPTIKDPPSDEEPEGADPRREYDDDESMADDPFESAILARHGGGPHGMSNTLRALSGMMSGTSSRLRGILEKLKQDDDPSMQLIALQELSELLLISTEDNLAGNFAPDQFLKELVKLMQPTEFGENPEMMLLACRCVANMMEALPTSTASVVYGNAIPVLVSKLLEIQYMDLAEQALITLEKISSEFPAAIVREGGLTACLTYLDFFATSVQRTAVTTAANCCRNIPEDSFSTVKDVMPILLNVLNSNDQRVVEQGCLCVSRIADSFKYQDDKIELLLSKDMLQAILRLLLPSSANLVGPNIHTQFLRVLSTTARASPKLTAELFKLNVVETLYHILTGVSPPSGTEDVAQKIDSVVIMQALIHRPRDQIFETLNVICELLPAVEHDNAGFLSDLGSGPGHLGRLSVSQGQQNTRDSRLAVLSECKTELRRFAIVLLPTLTDAYASTVNLSVRQRVLMAQLRMLSYLETDILEEALRPVPYSSYLASMLSIQDHPFLVDAALRASKVLLTRLDHVYRYQFCREGVMTEIRKLAERPTESTMSEANRATAAIALAEQTTGATSATAASARENERRGDIDSDDGEDEDMGEGRNDGEDTDDSDASPTRPSTSIVAIPNVEDLITISARQIIEEYDNSELGRQAKGKAESILETLRNLVTDITRCYDAGQNDEGAALFSKLAKYFEGDALESVTSHELLSSKVVSTLLDIFQDLDGGPNEAARAAFIEVFMGSASQQKIKTVSSQSPATPFSVLIHKLQDLLSRAEHFEVLTVHSNASDSNKSSAASMLAKQIRVKLVADDESGIPAGFRNIMVSIHAIAKFSALDDYLRPRISLSERVRSRALRDDPANLTGLASANAPGGSAPTASGASGPANPSTPAAQVASTSRSRSGARKSRVSSSRDAAAAVAAEEEASRAASSSRKPSSSRKSMRKSIAPKIGTEIPPRPPPPSPDADLTSQNRLEPADETHISEDEDEIDDDAGFDEIIDEFEETLDNDGPDPEAVNLEVAESGPVTARRDDGSRVETPTSGRKSASRPIPEAQLASTRPPLFPTSRSLLSSLAGSRGLSYAAALQSIPQDWHLEFSVNGEPISNETTIYRAVHFSAGAKDDISPRNIWAQTHSINFKRVEGPPPVESSVLGQSPEPASSDAASSMPQSLEKNPISAEILRLLRILHEMNSNLNDFIADNRVGTKINVEPVAQFINTKLTAKLNRQLEEPLIVASNTLPSWSEDLARLYPFLFPFETRHLFLQSTSFGYSRSMSRWQNSQGVNESQRSRHRDERPFLGRLQRQKVRISRQKILESAIKVLDLYGASPSILEVEYFEEVGTGLGPTLEFYSNISKEFSKKKLKMWRENESTRGDEFAFGKQGLFPAPMSEEQLKQGNGPKVLTFFTLLGKFVARSMLDSRIIDVSFNQMFFRLASGSQPAPNSLGAIKAVDEDLARSLQTIKQYVEAKRKIEREPRLSNTQKAQKLSRVQVRGAGLDDLGLDFTLPGYPSIELVPKGADIAVTMDNVNHYLERVIALTLGEGVYKQIEAFKTGFSQVFPYTSMRAFTPDELVMLFGRNAEDWSIGTLMDSTKADHGYNLDSKSVRNLLQSMSELTKPQRRDFLQFITGSPKLPIGGFKSLTPMFTVVCKASEPPYAPDDYLPSVMTCVNYLKLPDYSTLDVMRKQLLVAIREGQGAFHLS